MSDATATGSVIQDDRPCLACGYSLKGLRAEDQCPECGRAVALSLRGNLLKYSSAEYVASLHRGVFLVQAGIIAQVLWRIGSIVWMAVAGASGGRRGMPVGFYASGQFVGLVVSFASVLGWWLLSSPDPAYVGSDDGSTARKVVRVTVVIAGVAALLPLIAGQANLTPLLRGAALTRVLSAALLAMAASLAAWVVWYFAAMRYLVWLAPRVPDDRVARRAKLLTWLNPLVYVLGMAACGLGPLVALILYYNLLEWVRKDLGAVRAEQAAGVA